jgi:hypothetical protein
MTAALLPAGVAAMGETAAVAGPGSDPGGCCCCRLLSGPSPLLPSLLLPLGGLSPGALLLPLLLMALAAGRLLVRIQGEPRRIPQAPCCCWAEIGVLLQLQEGCV